MPGWEIIGEEERKAVNEVFDNGAVLFRQSFAAMRNDMWKVKEFEAAFAAKLGVGYAQAVSSGTAAVKVGLEALGVGPGDEVITQTHTFVATVEAIFECGATPVVADIDRTLNMDPADMESKITERTKVILPVHMLGVSAHMDEIMAIANRHGIPVLEDTAQALGTTYHGRRCGTIGKVGTFSFDHGKVLTTGEGGMVITDDHATFMHARAYQDHGHDDNPAVPRGEDTRSFPGFNFRMMELQGAVGIVQLSKLDSSIAKHRENKARLKSALKDMPEFLSIKFREIPDAQGDNGDSVVFFLENPERAKRVARCLQQRGIGFKNLPDALKWHFAGTWTHMFNDQEPYRGRDLERDVFRKSSDILRTAIAIPVFHDPNRLPAEKVCAEMRHALNE